MDEPRHHSGVAPATTVMIVDDDLLVRTTVCHLLTGCRGIRIVAVFSNGSEALAALGHSAPDVMLVDIAMPGMNGAELTRLIRSRHPQTRVLAYTSLASQDTLSDMLNAGAAGVVYKEASVGALAHAIRTVHGGLSVFSPRYSARLARPELDKPLTPTETDILSLLSKGLSNEQISELVHLSPSTVKYHITKLTDKLGATNRVTLAVAAIRLGLTDDP